MTFYAECIRVDEPQIWLISKFIKSKTNFIARPQVHDLSFRCILYKQTSFCFSPQVYLVHLCDIPNFNIDCISQLHVIFKFYDCNFTVCAKAINKNIKKDLS